MANQSNQGQFGSRRDTEEQARKGGEASSATQNMPKVGTAGGKNSGSKQDMPKLGKEGGESSSRSS